MHSSKKKFFLIDKCNLLAFSVMEVSYNKSLPTFFSKRLLRREHCVAELFSTNSNSCIELWGTASLCKTCPGVLVLFWKVPMVRLEMTCSMVMSPPARRTSLVSKDHAPSPRWIFQRKLIHLSLTVIQSGLCTTISWYFPLRRWLIKQRRGWELGPALYLELDTEMQNNS